MLHLFWTLIWYPCTFWFRTLSWWRPPNQRRKLQRGKEERAVVKRQQNLDRVGKTTTRCLMTMRRERSRSKRSQRKPPSNGNPQQRSKKVGASGLFELKLNLLWLWRDNLTHPHPPQLTKIGTMSELIPLFLITRDVFNRVRDELLLLDNICLLKSGNRYSFLVSILTCFLPNWPKKFKFDLFENWSDDFAGGGLNSSNVCLLWAYHCLVYVRERIHRRSEESWQQSCVQRQWTQ